MAIAIKAIPTLEGEDAIRFREAIERVDRDYDSFKSHDISNDYRFKIMKAILRKAKI